MGSAWLWEAYMAGRLAHGEAWRFQLLQSETKFLAGSELKYLLRSGSVQVNKVSAIHSGWGNIRSGRAH